MQHYFDVESWSPEKCRIIKLGLLGDRRALELVDDFRNDVDVFRALINLEIYPYPSSFSDQILDDQKTMLFAAASNCEYFNCASPRLRDDKTYVISCVRSGSSHILRHIPDKFRDDADVMLAAVITHGDYAMMCASKRLKSDKALMSYSTHGWDTCVSFASSALKGDAEFMLPYLRVNRLAVSHASSELRANKTIMLETVTYYGYAIEYVSADLKVDEDIVMAAVTCCGCALRLIPTKLKDCAKIVLAAVVQSGQALQYASERLKSDPTIVSAAVTQVNTAIKFASTVFRDDKKLAMQAIRANIHNVDRIMEYISDRLKSDMEVFMIGISMGSNNLRFDTCLLRDDIRAVLVAVTDPKHKHALIYASDRIKDDLEFAIKVAAQVHTTKYISNRIKANREFASALISANTKIMCLGLPYLSAELRSDKSLMLSAVSKDGLALEHVSSELKDDLDMVLTAASHNGLVLEFASAALKEIEPVVVTAVSQNGLSLEFASSLLKCSESVVMIAVTRNGMSLNFASSELRNTKHMVAAAVAQNGMSLKFASDQLQNDVDVVLAAVRNNCDAIQFASISLRCDRIFMLDVTTRYGCSLIYATPEIERDDEIALEAIRHQYTDIRYASYGVTGNKNVVMDVMQRGEICLTNLPEVLANDYDVVLEAVKHRGKALQYASTMMGNNLKIVLAAVAQDPCSIKYALIPDAATNKKLICTAAVATSHPDRTRSLNTRNCMFMYEYFRQTSGNEQDRHDFFEWLKMTGRALMHQRVLRCYYGDHPKQCFVSEYMLKHVMEYVGVPSTDLRTLVEETIRKYRSIYAQ